MCRPPSARIGKLNAFATPLRRVLHRSLVYSPARFRLSSSNRVTVKLITASFPETASPRNPRQPRKRSTNKPRPEKNAIRSYIRDDVDCNGKIRNKFREKFFRLVYPVALLLYLLLRDSLRFFYERVSAFLRYYFVRSSVYFYVWIELINDFPRILKYRNGNWNVSALCVNQTIPRVQVTSWDEDCDEGCARSVWRDLRIAQYRKSPLYKHGDLLLCRHLSSPAKYSHCTRVANHSFEWFSRIVLN